MKMAGTVFIFLLLTENVFTNVNSSVYRGFISSGIAFIKPKHETQRIAAHKPGLRVQTVKKIIPQKTGVRNDYKLKNRLNATAVHKITAGKTIVNRQVRNKIDTAKPTQPDTYDTLVCGVNIPAEFPGGINAWDRYLVRKIDKDIPVRNYAPGGNYEVSVSFVVDKTGTLSDIKAENDPGYGTKEEATRVIQTAPRWKPAIWNGRSRNSVFRLVIVFRVLEACHDKVL